MAEWSRGLGSEPWLWILIGVLILISGLFTAAETSLFSLGSGRLAQMEEQGLPGTGSLRRILAYPRRLLLVLVLGSQAGNLAAAALIAWIFFSRQDEVLALFPAWWKPSGSGSVLVLSLAVSILLILILSKAVPKAAGAIFRERLSRVAASPLWVLMEVLVPVRWTFQAAAGLVQRMVGAKPGDKDDESLGGEELRELLEAGSREGLLDVTEREILVNLLRSGEITADEIMTARHEIKSIPVEAGADEARALLLEHGYSRLPVYEGDRDHIVGVITVKDLIRIRLAEIYGKALSLREVMRPPLLVPETRRIRDLLLDFKSHRLHMALVMDEFGALAGVITMEDVLAEIFGETREEDEETELENLGENHWRVLGSMEIKDFNTITGARIPGSGNMTLAGMVLSRLGRRPRMGDQVAVAGFSFQVLEAQGIIIRGLEVKREPGP